MPAMNDPLDAPHRVGASVDEHATDNEFVSSEHNIGLAEVFQPETPAHADHVKLWPLSVGAELGIENGGHSEFITVFSHELRNSLSAMRSATRILRMEASAGPAGVRARQLIERQLGQISRLVEDLLDVSRSPQWPPPPGGGG